MSDNRNEPDKPDSGIDKRPADPFVAARVPDPASAPAATFDLSGLLGDSDRDGYRRLYLNTRLDYYVEFRTADVLAVESLGPDVPPFVGLDATRVSLSREATVEYVRTRTGGTARSEDFALDALPAGFTPDPGGPVGTDTFPTFPTFPTDTLPTDQITEIPTRNSCGIACTAIGCRTLFGATCRTCLGDTCITCETCATCANTCGGTCRTCVDTACVTRGATSLTRETCGPTCVTCRITQCNTCAVTCGPFRCITDIGCPTRFPPCA